MSNRENRSIRKLAAVFLLPLPLLIGSCEEESQEPLRVGLVVWPPYEMAYLARDLGYYEGANIELVDYGSPAEFVLAYQAGSLDAVGTVLDYALEIQYADPHQKIVLVIDHSIGGDAVVARSDIKSLEDLRGKRVGYEASALGAYVLIRMLEHAGLKRSDIVPVPVDIQDQEQSFLEGRFDAVVTYEPTVSILAGNGANILFDSSQIPEEIIDVLLVPDDVLNSKRAQLEQFVDGWFKALEYHRNNPEDAASRVVERQRLTPQDYLSTFEKVEMFGREANRDYLSRTSKALSTALENHQRIMIREGFLPGEVDISGMLDASLVR